MRRPGVALFLSSLPAVLSAHQAVEISVKDPSGRPVPGATVEASRPGLPKPVRGETDAQGKVHLDLEPGAWTLRITHPAFLALTRRLEVGLGQAHHRTFTLQPYAAATVAVEGKAGVADLSALDEPLNHLLGLATAASEGLVTPAELQARPYQRPGDLMEAVPGLLVSQHSGEGKANQYYLRGFNLDHGTDLSIRVASVPVNLPTNAHGQGYLDLNFLIPELVGRIQYRKGPVFAEEGDFASAGAVDIGYVHALPRPLLTLEGGSFGFRRALFAGSWKAAGGDLLVAQEGVQNDGPWDHPEAFRKTNTVLRWSRAAGALRLSATAMVYGAAWDATDQIPQRAVDSGLLGRFGALDPTDGGNAHRASLAFEVEHSGQGVRDRASVYGVASRLELISNFTGFLDDPSRGDQFRQAERRTYGGFQASRTMDFELGGRPLQVEAGLQGRWDHVPEVSLHHTQARRELETIRKDGVTESLVSPWVQVKAEPTPWLRATLGLRHDRADFKVSSSLPENGGRASASLTSPKLALAFGPWAETELYAAVGRGFHRNDARGTTLKVDPRTGDPAEPVTPLVKATGSELGLRCAAFPRWQWTLSLWRLDLASELVFLGDAGITEPSRPSRREGVEFANTVQLSPRASLTADLAWSKARFTAFDPAGNRIPGAVEGVGTLSLDVRPAPGWQVSAGLRYVGPRPLIEDDSVRAEASVLAQAKVAWEPSPRWKVDLELFNLANREAADIQYFYRSRLPGEPLEGVGDRHVHPVEPRSARLGVTWRW
jgi:hypothetical protein